MNGGPAPRQILVVEDDGDLRKTVAELLAAEGYLVVVAKHGLEALGYLKNADVLPDLIVLDLMLPVMDGWEFSAMLGRDRRLASIPVLVHSVYASRAFLDAVEVLTKPIPLERLLETVKRHAG